MFPVLVYISSPFLFIHVTVVLSLFAVRAFTFVLVFLTATRLSRAVH